MSHTALKISNISKHYLDESKTLAFVETTIICNLVPSQQDQEPLN